MQKQEVVLRLTRHQVYRLEQLGWQLWPGEEVSLGEVGRRLLLEYLLWMESEGGQVQKDAS